MIRAVVLDVDGVLTDGGIVLDDNGIESKRFHARDGVGIKLALGLGIRVLFLTARASQPARRRAEELGAEWAIGIRDKEPFLDAWLKDAGIAWEHAVFVGDDLQDLGCLRRVGWPVAVADAAGEVRDAARYVTRVRGGRGAVRDAVEHVLETEGRRQEAVRVFLDAGYSVGEASTPGTDS